jgi:hypothetical protein
MKRLLLVVSSAVLLLALAACSSGSGVSTWCKVVPQPYYTNALQADYGITNTGSSTLTVSSYGIEIFQGSKQDFNTSDSDAGDDLTIAPGQTYVQSGENGGYTVSGGLDTGDNRCQIVISGS